MRQRRRPRLDAPPPRLRMALGAVALVGLVLGSVVVVALAARGPGSLSPPSHGHFFPAWLAGPLGGVWPFPSTGTTLLHLFDYAVAGMYGCYILAVLCAPRLRRRWILGAILAAHVVFFLSPPLPLTDVFNYINYGRMEIVHGLNPYATIAVLEPHGDPSYALSNWHHLLSPYGPLFTLFTFALVPLGVATSFWIFKATLMLASLTTLFLIWRCAELLHRDPVRAVLLVGLNPPVLVWGLGGDHNDFLMVLFMMLAIYLALRSRRRSFSGALSVDGDWIGSRRPRLRPARAATAAYRSGRAAVAGLATQIVTRARASIRIAPARALAGLALPAPPADTPSGLAVAASAPAITVPGGIGARVALDGVAPGEISPPARHVAASATREKALQFGAGLAVVAACAIKLPAAILMPILFAVAPRRLYLLAGIATGLIGVGLASFAAFGAHLPDLGVQSNLVTTVGLPNLLGSALGLDGETAGLRRALTGLLLIAVLCCAVWARRRDRDWIVPAGVAVLVLVLTLSWQVPWYVLWLLPLAALAHRAHLRVASVVLGVYLILSFTWFINIRPPITNLQQMHSRETKYLVH